MLQLFVASFHAVSHVLPQGEEGGGEHAQSPEINALQATLKTIVGMRSTLLFSPWSTGISGRAAVRPVSVEWSLRTKGETFGSLPVGDANGEAVDNPWQAPGSEARCFTTASSFILHSRLGRRDDALAGEARCTVRLRWQQRCV